MKKISIYIADDHAILREGLQYILTQDEKYEVIGEAADGKTALDEIEKLKPDIALLDISMPVMTGLEVSRLIRKYNTKIKIVILSRHDNDEYVQEALQNDINGYILKDYAGSELKRAIMEVMAGNVYLSPKLIKNLTSRLVPSKKVETDDAVLSSREKQVLKLICEGMHNDDIAKILRIAVKTVHAHRQNIMKKLDIHSIAELVKYGIKNRLIEI